LFSAVVTGLLLVLLFTTVEDLTENLGGVLSGSGGGSIGLAPIGLGGCTEDIAGECCGNLTSPNFSFDVVS